MSKQEEYRQYAKEAMDSARTAPSDNVRKLFLDLAKMWMTAAQVADDNMAVLRSLRDEANPPTSH